MTTTNKNELIAFLEQNIDRYLDDLRRLCAIDSGSYDKDGVDEVQKWFATALANIDFDVELKHQERFGNDLLATRTGSGGRRVLLLGHADTVFPRGTASQRPVTIQGDKVLGPGTCDMKAGLLAGLYAIRALDEMGSDPLDRLTFLIVSDEEIGERHSIELLKEQGAQHDAIFTLEAARENGDIVTSRKAGCWMTVEATGKAAHAGVEPEKGASATLAISRVVVEAFKLNGMSPGMTVNPGEISGGSAPNVVADWASAHFDLRAWTNAGLDELRAAFRTTAEASTIDGVTLKITEDPGSGCPAMEKSAGVAALERESIGIGKSLGFNLKGAATGGGSDISFAGSSGTPGLDGLGPVGGLDHGPDEYILLESIAPRIALLAMLIERIGQEERFGYDRRTG